MSVGVRARSAGWNRVVKLATMKMDGSSSTRSNPKRYRSTVTAARVAHLTTSEIIMSLLRSSLSTSVPASRLNTVTARKYETPMTATSMAGLVVVYTSQVIATCPMANPAIEVAPAK